MKTTQTTSPTEKRIETFARTTSRAISKLRKTDPQSAAAMESFATWMCNEIRAGRE